MTRRSAALTVGSLVLVLLVCVAVFVPMPYVVMSPGVTENTLGSFGGQRVISVTGHKTYPTSGHLDLTTVSVTSPNSQPRLPDILRAWWSSTDIVLPRDVIYPPEESVAAVNKQNQTDMLDSQTYAIAAGLEEAGINCIKVEVEGVTAGAPADGVLRKGDLIVAVNGTRVTSTQDAVDAISTLPPGSRV
ncbi:MAG: Lon-like protease, partial [Gaiellales bacterium]|nr:Lon-like protease [Gaiellales bacterium]